MITQAPPTLTTITAPCERKWQTRGPSVTRRQTTPKEGIV
jgi:hypothetical protein